MKMDCNVIKDLLPLYAEKLTSNESNKLILEHVSNCQNCKKEYEKITENINLPTNINDYINLKKAKRKDRKNLIVGIIAVILLISLVFIVVKHYFPYLYNGDKITLSINGTIDDEKISLSKNDVVCKYDKKNPQEIKFEKSDKYKISTKGNEYGSYTFYISTEGERIVISLIHTNWWEIQNVEFDFNINSKNNTLTYKINDTIASIKPNGKSNSYKIYYMI